MYYWYITTEEDIDHWEPLVRASVAAVKLGGLNRDPAHEENGEPDKNAGDVEKQVAEGDLDSLRLIRDHRRHQGGGSGANVGSDSVREHLFDLDDVEFDEWGENGGGDGGRLDENCDPAARNDGEVRFDVRSALDEPARSARSML